MAPRPDVILQNVLRNVSDGKKSLNIRPSHNNKEKKAKDLLLETENHCQSVYWNL